MEHHKQRLRKPSTPSASWVSRGTIYGASGDKEGRAHTSDQITRHLYQATVPPPPPVHGTRISRRKKTKSVTTHKSREAVTQIEACDQRKRPEDGTLQEPSRSNWRDVGSVKNTAPLLRRGMNGRTAGPQRLPNHWHKVPRIIRISTDQTCAKALTLLKTL